jgi:group II intron reverse transcriptase/maturase
MVSTELGDSVLGRPGSTSRAHTWHMSAIDDLTARPLLREAFTRVQANHGCRGVDGQTVAGFAAHLETELDGIESSLRTGCYRPLPLLRFAVPKRSGGERQLAVPTVRDRVVQSAVYLLTRDLFEAEFEESSHGFRPGRSVLTAVRQIRALRERGFHWVVDADIDDYFASIPHARLFERLRRLGLAPELRELFERWIQAEVYDGRRLWSLTRGIPQGAVVSPMLANLLLDGLDELLAACGRRAVRYADDFVVLCRTAEDAADALELTDHILEALELDLNREKTRLTSFEHGFQFLGALFVGDAVYRRLDPRPQPPWEPHLPPPLDLRAYLELRAAAEAGG